MNQNKTKKVLIKVEDQGQHSSLSIRKGKGFQAIPGTDLRIEYDCRKADCGICIFQVVEGMEHLSPPTTEEQDFLQAMKADKSERLACQCRVLGDIRIKLEDNRPIV